jgi:hypothetical protein
MKRRHVIFATVLAVVLSAGFRYDAGRSAIINPNNMYLYDTLLLVSDSLNGLLIYSVADEQTPRYRAHIPVRGNHGMAMKDSIIYVNSWGAILAMRLVNDTNYEVTAVIKDDPYHSDMGYFENYGHASYTGGLGCSAAPLATDAYGGGTESGGSGGTGGSYAIFAVIDSFLYYINNRELITMDISDAAKPRKLSETSVDWSIETLFPTRDYLFIGGSSGMYVMDRTNPSQPTVKGSITHFRARDPVVVKDSMAYVTLRAGFNSRIITTDELMVVNLALITSPKLVKEIPLKTPYGLAIADTLLFVAQGSNGWTLFGLSDPHNPASLKSWSTPDVKDFIWIGDRLYVMCFDRIKIYSVSDPLNPVLVSDVK